MLRVLTLDTGLRRYDASTLWRKPYVKLSLLAGDHLVDGSERRHGFVGFSLGAERVGLVHERVNLFLVGFAHGVVIDLVLYRFLRGRELLGARAIGRFLSLSLRVSRPAHEARHGSAGHQTSEHLSLPEHLHKPPVRGHAKFAFDHGSSSRAAGWIRLDLRRD